MIRSRRAGLGLAGCVLALTACAGEDEAKRATEPPAQAAIAERLAAVRPAAPAEPTADETWGKSAPASGEPTTQGDDLRRARDLYEEAKHTILSGDLDGGIAHLQQVVTLDPEFGEAWYQLGAALTTQAVQIVGADEEAAIEKFDAGLAAKKTAGERMSRGALRVWDAFELRQAQEDLDAALADADAVRADRELLIAGLYLQAASHGYVQAEPAPEEQEPVEADQP